MATINHQPYHHTTTTTSAASTRRLLRHSLDYSSLPSSSSSSSSSTFSTVKHSSITYTNTIHHSSRTLTYAISTTTTTPASSTSNTALSLDELESHLANGDFRQADEETRRMLIVLAGEAAIKRGYVFFSEVQFIAKEDLKAIDDMWRKYSNDKFGYSVQKKVWLKCNKDFTRFFMKVGWMKKLDTEVEQYNYRSFPSEFMWDLNGSSDHNDDSNDKNDDNNNNNNNNVPPEGHLPLTNALRGTQLLNMILTHPAFDEGDDEANRKEDEKFDEGDQVVVGEADKKKSRLESLRDRLFKPNYSF